MASLTVRQLDDKLKRLLRLRAARAGRSMEDEVRVILRQAAMETAREALNLLNPANPPGESAQQEPAAEPLAAPPRQTASGPAPQRPYVPAAGHARVVLIIGGGIAAYKSLDLIRRLREHRIHVR